MPPADDAGKSMQSMLRESGVSFTTVPYLSTNVTNRLQSAIIAENNGISRGFADI